MHRPTIQELGLLVIRRTPGTFATLNPLPETPDASCNTRLQTVSQAEKPYSFGGVWGFGKHGSSARGLPFLEGFSSFIVACSCCQAFEVVLGLCCLRLFVIVGMDLRMDFDIVGLVELAGLRRNPKSENPGLWTESCTPLSNYPAS